MKWILLAVSEIIAIKYNYKKLIKNYESQKTIMHHKLLSYIQTYLNRLGWFVALKILGSILRILRDTTIFCKCFGECAEDLVLVCMSRRLCCHAHCCTGLWRVLFPGPCFLFCVAAIINRSNASCICLAVCLADERARIAAKYIAYC